MPGQNDVKIVTPYIVPIDSTPFPITLLRSNNVRTFSLLADNGEELVYVAIYVKNQCTIGLELAFKDGTTIHYMARELLATTDAKKTERTAMNELSNMLSLHNLKLVDEL